MGILSLISLLSFEYSSSCLSVIIATGIISTAIGVIITKYFLNPLNDSKSNFKNEEISYSPAVRIDSQKAFCKTVRFAMRLKKRMRMFKERKMKEMSPNVDKN